MRRATCCVALCFCLTASRVLLAGDRTVSVYVALADNERQGIVQVPKAIGNGDDPENNLYWGTADGLKGCFDKSKTWKLIDKTESAGRANILRTRTYRPAIRLCAGAAYARNQKISVKAALGVFSDLKE